jgi:hypothetical protein
MIQTIDGPRLEDVTRKLRSVSKKLINSQYRTLVDCYSFTNQNCDTIMVTYDANDARPPELRILVAPNESRKGLEILAEGIKGSIFQFIESTLTEDREIQYSEDLAWSNNPVDNRDLYSPFINALETFENELMEESTRQSTDALPLTTLTTLLLH